MSTATGAKRPAVAMDLIAFDTADLDGSAAFWSELLGWTITDRQDDWITVRGDGGTGIAFQLAPDHVPPTWPDNAVPQQLHLDLNVADLDEAEEFALSLGARKAPAGGHEQHSTSFRVYLDPSGHPFCLCKV